MEKDFVGAVDIGGTKIHVGIVNTAGKSIIEESFLTRAGERTGEEATEEIAELLCKFCATLGIEVANLKGIGIACAGPLDLLAGTVENPYTLPGWEGYPIVRRMKELTGVKVVLENDANAALLGEVLLKGLTHEKVLMLTLGTGIGVASWNRGQLYREGKYHPEMGHVVVSSEGDECYCGHRGCFESLCSGSAVNRRSQDLGYENFDHLYHSFRTGDRKALKFIEEFKQEIKNGVWNLSIIFKPHVIILAGGLARDYFEFFKTVILEECDGNKKDFVELFQILPADKGINPALAGANMMLD